MRSVKFTRSPRSPGFQALFYPEAVMERIIMAVGRMISKIVITLIVAIHFILHQN